MKSSLPLTQLGPDDMHRYLRGIEYPITKENVLNIAREHGAPAQLLEKINKLLIETFSNPEELLHFFEEQEALRALNDHQEFS
jgi:hypothetical protein